MKSIAFFNNKGGVGKTSLVYHLAWMYSELGLKVIAADLDPQANLTSMFLEETRLLELWPDGNHPLTIYGAIQPIIKGTGDIVSNIHLEHINDNIDLIVGDLALSAFEDELSEQWPKAMDGRESAFRVISAFYRLLLQAAERQKADVVLIDVGPNLGAINRAALIAADYVIVPLAPDLFSLQGLRNLGPTLRRWRKEWKDRLQVNPAPEDEYLPLPLGEMQPTGYIILQHPVRLDRPVQAYARWMGRIPSEYNKAVLGNTTLSDNDLSISVQDDKNCLATIKNYRSLVPLAMEAHTPVFLLKAGDGAIGSHQQAVHSSFRDFESLAKKISSVTGVLLPPSVKIAV